MKITGSTLETVEMSEIQRVIHTLNNIPFDDGTSAFILNMSYAERTAADLVCEFLSWMNACRKGETYSAPELDYLAKLEKSLINLI